MKRTLESLDPAGIDGRRRGVRDDDELVHLGAERGEAAVELRVRTVGEMAPEVLLLDVLRIRDVVALRPVAGSPVFTHWTRSAKPRSSSAAVNPQCRLPRIARVTNRSS